MSEQIAVAGWREWLSLPDFNISQIEAKIDTGTKTSVLHTTFIEPFHQDGQLWVRFGIQPVPERSDLRMVGFEPVVDRRMVKDAEGADEIRFVIETTAVIGKQQQKIELSLTQTDAKIFRMVLGRTALQKLGLLVNPDHTYLLGSEPDFAAQVS